MYRLGQRYSLRRQGNLSCRNIFSNIPHGSYHPDGKRCTIWVIQSRKTNGPLNRLSLDSIGRQRPDLVLSDIVMPNVDGFGLLKELRSSPDTNTVPVILLPARAGKESRVEGLEAGADDYLVKPFSARELLARVQTHLEIARIRQEASKLVRENEERLRAFVTASSDVIYRMSPDWTQMYYLQGKDFIADTYDPNSGWLSRLPISVTLPTSCVSRGAELPSTTAPFAQ